MSKNPTQMVQDQINFYQTEIQWFEAIRSEAKDNSVTLNTKAATMIAKAQTAILILTDYKQSLENSEKYS